MRPCAPARRATRSAVPASLPATPLPVVPPPTAPTRTEAV